MADFKQQQSGGKFLFLHTCKIGRNSEIGFQLDEGHAFKAVFLEKPGKAPISIG